MTLNEVKQYCKIIADETNVHNVTLRIMNTDKGALILRYVASPYLKPEVADDLFLELGGERVVNERLEKMIPGMFTEVFNQINR